MIKQLLVAAMVASITINVPKNQIVQNTTITKEVKERKKKVKKYTTDYVNFRTKKSLESIVYEVLPINTEVKVYETTNKWTRVFYDGKKGYIYSEYLSDNLTVNTIATNRWGLNLSEEEKNLLASILWVEARGEGIIGEQAVCEVVLNRVYSNLFPNTLYEVLSQSGQFSSWNLKGSAIPGDMEYTAIENVLNGTSESTTIDTLYFSTSPQNNNITTVIGNHYFCR